MDIFPDVFLILLLLAADSSWQHLGHKLAENPTERLLSFFKLYHDNTFSSGLGVGI